MNLLKQKVSIHYLYKYISLIMTDLISPALPSVYYLLLP